MSWVLHHRALVVLLLFVAGVAGAAVVKRHADPQPVLIYDETPRPTSSIVRERLELLCDRLERLQTGGRR